MRLMLAGLMVVIVSLPTTAAIPRWQVFVVNITMGVVALYVAYQAGRER